MLADCKVDDTGANRVPGLEFLIMRVCPRGSQSAPIEIGQIGLGILGAERQSRKDPSPETFGSFTFTLVF